MTQFKKIGLQNKGSVKWILLIIIALVLASYFFDFSVQEAIEDEQTQSNFGYIKNNISHFYDTYLKDFLATLWSVFKEYVWGPFVENMDHIKNGEPTNLDQAAGNLQINLGE